MLIKRMIKITFSLNWKLFLLLHQLINYQVLVGNQLKTKLAYKFIHAIHQL